MIAIKEPPPEVERIVTLTMTETEARDLCRGLNAPDLEPGRPGATYRSLWDDSGPSRGAGKRLYYALRQAGVSE